LPEQPTDIITKPEAKLNCQIMKFVFRDNFMRSLRKALKMDRKW